VMPPLWCRVVDRLKHDPRVLRLADRLGRGSGRRRPLDALFPPPRPRLPDLAKVLSADVGVACVGHATVLLRLMGRTILTDPVWSNRIGLGLGVATLGPRRRVAPAIPFARLPPIDLIVVSHAHFDHLDLPTLRRLALRDRDVPVVTAAKTADLLAPLPFRRVTELDVVGAIEVAGVRVEALPVAHWTPRVFADTWRGANAYAMRRKGRSVLFGGDTAMTRAFDGAGPFDLAVLGIGAYDPFRASHATPEEAWAMARACGAERLAAVHHGTFRLSREALGEPLSRLLSAAGSEAWRVVVREVGEGWPR